MGGLFGVTGKQNCAYDLFFGVDYHSHLGTVKGGMAVLGDVGFTRVIHNIQNSPFRTKFENDVAEMTGNSGIGCISDTDSQPLVVKSHLGDYAIACVGKINNVEQLLSLAFKKGGRHFLEGSRGQVNSTELVATIIDGSASFVEGIHRVFELIDGSMSMLILTRDGVIAARDKLGRTPLVLGGREDAVCVSSESFAFLNLGYRQLSELGPGEIVRFTPEGVEQLSPPGDEMRICSFLWTYYGYPSSSYEGVNVENMRYRCGAHLAEQDGDMPINSVAGVPDSGIAHAIGYAQRSGVPFTRPLIKYTPTWPRSFTPRDQGQRDLIARMKLIPVDELVRGRRLLFIDDSIVRGTQLKETADFLYRNGAEQVHVRPACPPIMFSCKYINFSRSTSPMELITRRIIQELEGRCDDELAYRYADDTGEKYQDMVSCMCDKMQFSSLKFLKLGDLTDAVSLPPCKLCTYCWSGRE